MRLLLVLPEQRCKLGGEVAEVTPELPVLPRVAPRHVPGAQFKRKNLAWILA